MFLLRRSGSRPVGTTGVAWNADGFALAHVRREGTGAPRLVACDQRETRGDATQALRAAVRHHGLAGSRCVWVLPPGSYSLRLVDAPDVAPEELRDAARWLVKDLIEFDPAAAAIAVLDMPQSPSPARPRKLYVAAARPEVIRRAMQECREAGLELAAVTVPEGVLLHAASAPTDARSVALLQLRPKDGVLAIGEAGWLYAARHLSVSLEQLEDVPEEDAADRGSFAPGTAASSSLEHLLLEIQRSLDYYESAFGRSPVTRLLVAPSESEVSGLLPYLAQNLHLEVRAMEATEALRGEGHVPHALQARCLPAIGAALAPDGPGLLDLYGPEFESSEPPLSARRLVQASIVAAGILVVVGGWAMMEISAAHRELTQLESRREVLAARVAELGRQQEARPADPDLEARVRGLTQERDAKARLLENLTHHARAEAQRFPGVLEGLALRPVPELWLREIHLSDAGRELGLAGSSLEADRIPHFLQQLEGEPFFAGTEFRVLRLVRDAEAGSRVDFTLSTRLEAAE